MSISSLEIIIDQLRIALERARKELTKLKQKEQPKSDAQRMKEMGEQDKNLVRTKADVKNARAKAVMGGCCNRFADNQACDCMENAWLYPWSSHTDPSHEWGRGSVEKERRCVKCGAYRHLWSRFMPCQPPIEHPPLKDEGNPLSEPFTDDVGRGDIQVDNHGFGHIGDSEFKDNDPKPKEY